METEKFVPKEVKEEKDTLGNKQIKAIESIIKGRERDREILESLLANMKDRKENKVDYEDPHQLAFVLLQIDALEKIINESHEAVKEALDEMQEVAKKMRDELDKREKEYDIEN